MLAVDDAGAWIVQTPRLPMKANGSGDVTAALFTAHYVRTGDARARAPQDGLERVRPAHPHPRVGRARAAARRVAGVLRAPAEQFPVRQVR